MILIIFEIKLKNSNPRAYFSSNYIYKQKPNSVIIIHVHLWLLVLCQRIVFLCVGRSRVFLHFVFPLSVLIYVSVKILVENARVSSRLKLQIRTKVTEKAFSLQYCSCELSLLFGDVIGRTGLLRNSIEIFEDVFWR